MNCCNVCKKLIRTNSRVIQCFNCNEHFHAKCISKNFKITDYNFWLCFNCRQDIFPYINLTDSELLNLTFNSNTECLCSSFISKTKLDLLPKLELTETTSKIPFLFDVDADHNMPLNLNFKYYSVHDFHSDNEINNYTSSDAFSMLHCNTRSISANFDALNQLLCDLNHSFSIIGLSETKLKVDKENLSNISLRGYTFLSNPSLTNAGGVGLYVKNNLNFNLREDLNSINTVEFESIWIEVEMNNKNLICGVIYRHPSNSNNEAFLNYLNSTAEKINKENKHCAVMGDFNFDLLNWENHSDTEEFFNLLGSYYFLPHILQPTRITDHSATLIDNIFFNSAQHLTISGNILHDLTDHLPNFLIIKEFKSVPNKTKAYKRDYKHYDEEAFLEEMKNIDWTKRLPESEDINQMFDTFYSTVSSIVDKHIPLKQLSKSESLNKSKPWITSALRESIKIKNKLYKKYLKHRSSFYHSKYKIYRNKINHLLRISKKQYYHEYFYHNNENVKKIWKGIKEIISHKSLNNNLPSKINKNGTELTDNKSIANAFNDFFANIGSDLASKIPKINGSPHSYLGQPNSSTFFLFPTSCREIEDIISGLKSNKANGPYSIPTKIIKLLKNILSKPLEILYNSSFARGVVPDKFKIARVIPIYKKASHNDLSNYRPISLLSIFNILLEKLMAKRLTDFIEKHEIIYNKQFGFRHKHSTIQAVLSITDKIQSAIDAREYSCGIFLDFSKAFDTINHKILISKLENYGIRGLAKEWFCSYLSNRKQFVTLNDCKSDLIGITCGVPQGSVLGPLLFLLYINDFKHSSSLFDFHLFADDSNLFLSNKNLRVLESNINTELQSIYKWLCINKLSLNIDKSNFVIFHPPQKKLNYNVQIMINQTYLKNEQHVRYLGIMIDANLNWKHQIHHIVKKIKRSIGLLSKIRHYVNEKLLVNLYYALLYPFLTYGVVAWGHTYSSTLQPIFVLQKRIVRIITFSDYRDHSNPLFKRLNILKFFDLIYLHTAIFMHDYASDKLPVPFHSFFTDVNKIHCHNTRLASKSTYSLPRVRTNYGKFSIKFQGVKIWNSLDEEIKAFSRNTFKKKLSKTILDSY